jgi:transposase/transposase-like protein
MYSSDCRSVGVRAYLRLKSLRRTSTLLGISKSTIQRWVMNSPIVQRHRQARKVTADAIKLIETIVQESPFDTPAKIASKVEGALRLHLSTSSVRFWMKRQNIARKKTSRHVTTPELEAKRVTFAKDYSSVYHPDRVVSIDESSFYFDMKPAHGYCHRSRRLSVPARPGGRIRWSLIMAVTNQRVVGWRLIRGSINSSIFSTFMSSIETDGRDVVLLDNASIHKTSNAIDTMMSRGFTPCFLPPYSPEFQPIENAFSIVKNAFRRVHQPESTRSAPEQDADMEHRLQLSIQSLSSTILSHQFLSCWRNALDYTG